MAMNADELAGLLAAAKRAAREAGALQKAKVNTSFTVEYKSEIDLVTEVDKKCEEIVVGVLHGDFPDHDIMAEEGSAKRKDSPFKWIIDPLDGTTNFAHGYPLFCVSIALEYRSEVMLGVVYDGLHDELFHAIRAGGAFLNDRPIRTSLTSTIRKALLTTGFAYNLRTAADNNLEHFRNMLMNAQAVRRDGVAAIDLCYAACGRTDGFWELNLFPWDVAAGTLVLTEAGGRVTRFNGSVYSIYDKDICATNGKIHDEVIKVLTG
jgi:myo-inositol-1(or 4)-monophosphatase